MIYNRLAVKLYFMSKKFWKIAHTYEMANMPDYAILYLQAAKKNMPEFSYFLDSEINRIKGSYVCLFNDLDFFEYEKYLSNQISKIEGSGLFDEKWFLKKYKDIDFKELRPLEFFVRFGNAIKLDPNKYFSTEIYIGLYGGKWIYEANAFYRYLVRGLKLDEKTNAIYILDEIFKRNKEILVDFDFIKNAFLSNLRYTLSIIKANNAINKRDESAWLFFVNEYLSEFVKYKLTLSSTGGSLFERLCLEYCETLKSIPDGDLITVIMPAWNAEKTIRKSVNSILNQTWRNIELIIVDDASTDSTYNICLELAEQDNRVKIIRNLKNVGPYVSKNRALKIARGEWVTGHDADDYALPDRLEMHIRDAIRYGYDASVTYMIRMRTDGIFDHLSKVSGFSFDGVARRASITCLFRRKVLLEKLGFWDSVRYGADSELIDRAEIILKEKFGVIRQISMICLSLDSSLTNNPVTGIRADSGRMSKTRKEYKDSWVEWHEKIKRGESGYVGFPSFNRSYKVPDEMDVKDFL